MTKAAILQRVENINKNKNRPSINQFIENNQNLIQVKSNYMSSSQSQKQLYQKLQFLSSIPSRTPFDSRKLSQNELFEVCQYIEPSMITRDKHGLLQRISSFREKETGDSCLHIASKASNKKLVQYLAESKIIDANLLNNKKQNALTSVLANSQDEKAEEIAYILANFTDLSQRNLEGKRAFEVSQAKMDPMRARLLENLRKRAAGK